MPRIVRWLRGTCCRRHLLTALWCGCGATHKSRLCASDRRTAQWPLQNRLRANKLTSRRKSPSLLRAQNSGCTAAEPVASQRNPLHRSATRCIAAQPVASQRRMHSQTHTSCRCAYRCWGRGPGRAGRRAAGRLCCKCSCRSKGSSSSISRTSMSPGLRARRIRRAESPRPMSTIEISVTRRCR